MFKFGQEGGLENSSQHENLKFPESRVVLEFMRHSKKEDGKGKKNDDIRLSDDGRKLAQQRGKELDVHPEVSLGWGSPRDRTQETVSHIMLANEDIDSGVSLEEIEKIIAKELKVGKKIKIDDGLNFDFSGPEGEEMLEAYKKGEYIKYLVEKSDQRAIDLKDKDSSTQHRYVSGIANIIERYLKVGNNFNRIVSKKDKYEKLGNQLERYVVTHQGVIEGFMAKVLEKQKGLKARDEFVSLIGNGFDETRGMNIQIINKGTEQKVILTYELDSKKEEIELDEDLIKEMIKESNEFENNFE